jgi:hypothetical protein
MEPADKKSALLRHIGALLLLLCAVLAGSPWLDKPADSALSNALSSTLVLFASVRGVDAVVSAVAGTELSMTPAGVGMTLAPGELLDPVNDLIEQLGELLMLVLTLLGLEKLGLALLGSFWVRALTATLLATAAGMLWLRPTQTWSRGVRKLVLMLVMVRVLLPLAAIGGELIARHVVDTRAGDAESALVLMSQNITAEQEQTAATASDTTEDPQPEPGFFDRLGDAVQSVGSSLDVQARMARLALQLESGVNHLVDLLALVTLRAVLFPALFLFACWLLLRVAED